MSNIDPLGLDWKIRAKGAIRITIGIVGDIIGYVGLGAGIGSEGASLGTSSPISIPLIVGSAALIGVSSDQIVTGWAELGTGEPQISQTENALGEIGNFDRKYDISGTLINLEISLGPNFSVPITQGVSYALRSCSYYVIEVRYLSSLKNESATVTKYYYLAEQNAVEKLLYGGKIGENLPSSKGVAISKRPTVTELENLTAKHNVEFAVSYKLGPGKRGGGGQYYIIFIQAQ